MTQLISEVFNIGPCSIAFNGVDLGHTDETGVKVAIKGKLGEAKVAKYGDSPVAVWMNGQTVEIDMVISETDMTILANAFAGMTQVTSSGGASKLTLGQTAGTPITPYTLVITPYQMTSPVTNFTCQAHPMGDFDVVYEGGKWAGYKCKFHAVINESGGAQNSWLATFGDSTITADGTHPTVSGVVPADAATGVSTSTTVVATCTKALQGPTVNTATVQLIKDPAGTPALIPGTVALVNNGSSTTVTFTPTSVLTASKTYCFVMSGTILGQNELYLGTGGGFLSYFQT